ncbi:MULTISPECIES: hypothetical protein [Coprobacillaceae]|uniref:hypothetical protein n=1 Tax=Coprobacillaceae TaxID=2810280 RepID=UPI000E47EDB9|nr:MULTISPECIES: hypothetical protein [Coprobacillaceae]RHM61699.1 hypothetical protein DWZ53_04505 [Coprobacillus sp. AF33-1AC]RHS92533.1 hypothetical protein DW911_08515 [Erysipelatoclostridium sp. AM42-17]
MKEYLVDICLVALLIFFINGLFGHNQIEHQLFNQNLTSFEEKIKKQEVSEEKQGMNYQQDDNQFSKIIKRISDFCISFIKTIVLIISNFISTLLS